MHLILILAGILGAGLDVLLHVVQLVRVRYLDALQRYAADITLASVILISLSLIVQFNAGTLLLCIFLATLAITSKITGKEFDH